MTPIAERFRGPARILIVADELLAKMITLALDHGVFDTHAVGSVSEAKQRLASAPPHLLILDLDLEHAQDLLGHRVGRTMVPSIALTRRGDVKTKIAAFERGADDLVTVPVDPDELVARVFALIRRAYGEVAQFVPKITVRELVIDLSAQTVRSGRSTLKLTAIERGLLYLFASNPERIMSREEILDALWGKHFAANSNVVDRHVRNLRVKLKDSWKKPRYIETIPGKGYRFVAQDEASK